MSADARWLHLAAVSKSAPFERVNDIVDLPDDNQPVHCLAVTHGSIKRVHPDRQLHQSAE